MQAAGEKMVGADTAHAKPATALSDNLSGFALGIV
jgi:hypothetical protein